MPAEYTGCVERNTCRDGECSCPPTRGTHRSQSGCWGGDSLSHSRRLRGRHPFPPSGPLAADQLQTEGRPLPAVPPKSQPHPPRPGLPGLLAKSTGRRLTCAPGTRFITARLVLEPLTQRDQEGRAPPPAPVGTCRVKPKGRGAPRQSRPQAHPGLYPGLHPTAPLLGGGKATGVTRAALYEYGNSRVPVTSHGGAGHPACVEAGERLGPRGPLVTQCDIPVSLPTSGKMKINYNKM